MRLVSLVSAAVLLLSLSACVTESSTPVADPVLNYASVVATKEVDFAPKPGTTLRWSGELIVSAPLNVSVDPALLAYTQNQISGALQRKGYTVSAAAEAPADFILMGLVLLGDDINDQTLRDKLGFDPGINVGHTGYQKGSVVLLIKDANTRLPQWRAVVQMLVIPDQPKDVREERIRKGTEKLVSSLPTLSSAN